MNCAILFTYHVRPDVCIERLRILRRLNPGLNIYGLYGGPSQARPGFQALRDTLDADYAHPEAEPRWLWCNYDKVICHWFKDAGRHLPWDVLFVHSWDLLLLEPAASFSRFVGKGEALLPGLRRLEDMDEEVLDPKLPPIQPGRWFWARQKDFPEFKSYLDRHHPGATIYCEVSPFAVLHREVLELCSRLPEDLPGFNEYRFPTMAHQIGCRFVDPPLPDWFWTRYQPRKQPWPRETVLRKESRLYHPVYDLLTCEDLHL